MGFWQDMFDVYGIRARGRAYRAAAQREIEQALREREVAALEQIAAARPKHEDRP